MFSIERNVGNSEVSSHCFNFITGFSRLVILKGFYLVSFLYPMLSVLFVTTRHFLFFNISSLTSFDYLANLSTALAEVFKDKTMSCE